MRALHNPQHPRLAAASLQVALAVSAATTWACATTAPTPALVQQDADSTDTGKPPVADAFEDGAADAAEDDASTADGASDAGDELGPDVGPPQDAGTDVTADSALDVADSGPGPDAVADAASDAQADSGGSFDTAGDAGQDAVADVSLDSAIDASPDAGTPPALLAPCDSSKNCTGAAKVCDLSVHGCVGCLASGDCPPGQHCAGKVCAPGAPCTSDLACKSTKQVCDKKSGACVDCLSDGDCGTNAVCKGQVCKGAEPCTSSKQCSAVCNPAKGICQDCLSAADCPPGQACAAGSCAAKVCAEAQCVGGAAFACTDGSAYAAGQVCADGSACTQDSCVAGICQFTVQVGACEDKNACTNDSCGANGCVHAPTGGPCEDGDLCTQGDSCVAGKCSTGKAKLCDDQNPCTTDGCQSGTCSFVASSGPCDDQNTCTSGDVCAGGKCSGKSSVNCDDGDACTADSCNAQSGQCTHTETCAAKTVTVPYSTSFSCAGTGGEWLFQDAVGAAAIWNMDATPAQPAAKSPGCSLNFNDGQGIACTKALYGLAHMPRIDASNVPADKPLVLRFWLAGSWGPALETGLALYTSTDGVKYNITEVFNPPTSGWQQVAVDLSTLSGKKFYAYFIFYASKCTNAKGTGPFIDDLEVVVLPCQPAKCADGNPCSTDACDLLTAKCTNVPNWSDTCSDGNPCTAGDFCFELECVNGLNNPCDDGSACTTDSCDKATGKCTNAVVNCSDGNACTTDGCDKGNGKCQFLPAAGSCSDGNACTAGDTCVASVCKAGAAKVCDDLNPCTSDSCSPASGQCEFAVKTDICSDGDLCTDNDTCIAGKCTGTPKACGDGNECTDDICKFGVCQNVANSAPCGSSATCSACSAGKCTAGITMGTSAMVFPGNELRSVLPIAGGGYAGVGNVAAGSKGGQDGWFVRHNTGDGTGGSQEFGGPGNDTFSGHLVAGDGYLLWGSQAVGNSSHGWLIRVNALGGEMWSKTYPGVTGAAEGYRCVAWAGGWVLGGSQFAKSQEGWLTRVGPSGDKMWSVALTQMLSVAALVPWPDGSLGVVGRSSAGELAIVRIGADGKSLAVSAPMAAGTVTDAVLSAAGTLVVYGQFPGQALGLAAFDIGGKKLWSKTFSVEDATAAGRIVQGPGGGFLISGQAKTNAGGIDGWLGMLDSTGKNLWSKNYGGTTDDPIHGINFVGGRIYTAGSTKLMTPAGTGMLHDLTEIGDIACECQADADCDDKNECTYNFCHLGGCVDINNAAGTACGSGGKCDANGKCLP